MYRRAIEQLEKWQKDPHRKPLVVDGARQVGKTWLLKHFGASHYNKLVYVNLEEDELARQIFDGTFDSGRIISRLAIHTGVEITPGDTLIVIDEAQENARALTVMKYFCESAPEYHLAVAGSLLGISLHKGDSFPVGKVDSLTIYPLTFEEFLIAIGKKRLAEELMARNFDLLIPFHDELNELQKIYTVVGGMPEVVQAYVDDGTMLRVREIQKRIIHDYERDFSKYADKFDAPKILEIFNIIPAVLAKENKKFMFGMIKQSARAREYEAALLWLVNAGIATRVNRVKKVALPLPAYLDMGAFKLFMVDIGLLGCRADLRPETIYNEKTFKEFKGAMAEQFVFQELRARGHNLFYYSADDANTEVDFVMDSTQGLVPIEVKSGKALASASLGRLLEAQPELSAIKFSTLPYKQNAQITNMPLYAAGAL